MKVLIVSGSFYPQNSPRSFRTTQLAKELSRQGHEVRVYIPYIKYDYTELMNEYKTLDIRLCENLTWSSIKFYGNRFKKWMCRIIRRILIQFFEYPAIQWYLKMPQILRDEKGYDLLISIAVPHTIHWGIARCIRKEMNISKTWVADCGDPYMGCGTASFKRPFYFSYLEKSFCKRADFITIPIEKAKEGYYPDFHQKIKVIPQAFNFDEVIITNHYIPNEIITFVYAGSFIQNERDPRPVLDYLISIKFDFRFIVYTNQYFLFEDYLSKLGDKLIINDYLPRIELLYEMSKADFLLNLECKTNIQRPSKLIDYALSKRPILSVYSQKLDIDKLNRFLHRDYSQKLHIDNFEDYNIINAAKKFIDLVDK